MGMPEDFEIVTLRLKLKKGEGIAWVHREECRGFVYGDLFAELEFYRNETDRLQCDLRNVIDNPARESKKIATRALLDSTSKEHRFKWRRDELGDQGTDVTSRIRLTRFKVGEDLTVTCRDDRGPVDEWAWAITRNDSDSFTLNRDGEFEHEPFPSSRTPEYLKDNRYTFQEAITQAERWETVRRDRLKQREEKTIPPGSESSGTGGGTSAQLSDPLPQRTEA